MAQGRRQGLAFLGAAHLVGIQKPDGSWSTSVNFGPLVDTSFAIMFLGRANLVRDLTDLFNRRLKSNVTGGPKASVLKPPGDGGSKNSATQAGQLDPAEMTKALTAATGASRPSC